MKLSDDARTFLGVLIDSRVDETPTRRARPRQVRSADEADRYDLPLRQHRRCLPIVPVSPNAGVSREDIRERLLRWGVSWTYERVTVVVVELSAARATPNGDAILVKGPRGYHVSALWSPLLRPLTDEQRDGLQAALARAHAKTSAMMLHAAVPPFRLDYTPMDARHGFQVWEALEALGAVLNAMTQVVSP